MVNSDLAVGIEEKEKQIGRIEGRGRGNENGCRIICHKGWVPRMGSQMHFISVAEICETNGPILAPSKCVVGTHPTRLLQFFVAKEVRRVIFMTYAMRAMHRLADIPKFTMLEANKGLLSESQQMYCNVALGLLPKKKLLRGREGEGNRMMSMVLGEKKCDFNEKIKCVSTNLVCLVEKNCVFKKSFSG